MAERRFVFGVDLDGVCANFYSGLKPIAAEWLGVDVRTLPEQVSWGLPEWGVDKAPGGYEALHRFAVTQRDLFKILLPMPGAPQALRILSDANVHIRIITHRLLIKYFHRVAAQQTIEWLDKYDIPYWDLCFMREKAAVGANLYIEDSPDNIKRLREEEHRTIVFTNSANKDLEGPHADTWEQVLQIVFQEKKAWEKSLGDSSP